MSSSSVTSASSKFVSCGIVVYDSTMLRAIVCRIRDIFSIRTPPKSSVSGRAGRRDAARHRGGHLLVRFADVGAHVFDRDAAAGAGGPHAAEIDAQLPRQPAHGRAGRRGGVAIAGNVDFVGDSPAGAPVLRRPWLRRLRLLSRLSSAGCRLRIRLGFFGLFGFGFGLRRFSASAAGSACLRRLAAAASISMIGAPTSTVSPSLTRILVILPACGAGIGIVALSVSTSSKSWLALTVSPSLTKILSTSPDSIFSPRLGSLICVDIVNFKSISELTTEARRDTEEEFEHKA